MFTLRLATATDAARLTSLIDASVRGLQTSDYTSEQIDGALRTVYGVDSRLIEDGTYFVVESGSEIVGCGGWSKRKTLFGGDQYARRQDDQLDPRVDAAKIRAFFVHPDWARRGIGTMILDACERAATEAGFTMLEMGATLTGVPMYGARGYAAVERVEVPVGPGVTMTIVRMEKRIAVGGPHR